MKFLVTITRISTYVVKAKDRTTAYKIANSSHSSDNKVPSSIPEQAISIQQLED